MANRDIKKIVLAYSGGLDTSIILKWLTTTYGCEVVTFTADLGQGEELGPAREKALMLGIKPGNIFIEDLREELRARLRLPDVPRQRAVRGAVSARHLDRAAADRKRSRSRSRNASAPMRFVMARRAKATTRCASSSPITRSTPRSRSWPRGGSGAFKERRAVGVRAREPDPGRQGQGRRGAVLGRREPAALLVRGQGAGGPGGEAAEHRLSAHDLADGGAGQGDHGARGLYEGRRGERKTARRCRPRRCSRRSITWAATTASAGSIWWRTVSSA